MIRFGAPTMVTLVSNKVYRMIWFGTPQHMLLHPWFTRDLSLRKVDLILVSCSSTTIVYWFIMYLKTSIYLNLFG
ncbi:hypothetical protein Hdeb2414_s0387g00883171 [Helianthus debilis subsp. tardiflorus]